MFAEPGFKGRERHDEEPVHILLLEDDPLFAELIRAQLRRTPWVDSRLEVAGTLAGAMAKLAGGKFGLVLADLNLPDSSGLATLEALSRAGEQLIIVLTGSREPGLRAAAVECGAYDFLSKDELSAAALERLLRLAAMQSNTYRSLRDSEARFRGLVMQSSDWYWEQDEALRFTQFDGRVTEISGNHPSQALGKRRWEIPGMTPVSCTWDEHRAVLESRRPFRGFVYSRVGDDGQLRYISVSGEPVYRGDGSFAGYRGLATDVTPQQRAEEELRRFRLAMDNSADMILLTDRAVMRHIDVNVTACRLLGYSREELLAMGPQDVLPVSRKELEDAYDRLIADPSQASGMKSYYRCKDGSRLPFESTRRVMRSGDTWILVAISRDIRERLAAEEALRHSEARFRGLAGLSSDMYWEQDTEYRFTAFRGNADHPLEARRSQLIGRKRWDQSYLNMTPADWAAHIATLDARKSFRELELCRLDEAGGQVWISVSGEPVFDEAGAFAGYRGVGSDITKRKRGQRLLQLEHSVTRCLADAENVPDALRGALRAICMSEGWESGRYFHLDEAAGVMCYRESWAEEGSAMHQFNEASRTITFARGIGLVGQVWASGEPLWVPDVTKDPRVANTALASAAGLHGAVVFPVAFEGRIIGVLTLSSRTLREPDRRLLQAMRVISSQIGQFLKRKEAESVLRESEERFRSLGALSSDWFWETDAEHRFLGTPPRVTEITGYKAPAYVGKRRWEVDGLLPVSGDWKEHWQVLERRESYRDLELVQQRPDGSRVYLHVSGEPVYGSDGTFKGYRGTAKDVSARKREEEELRRFRAAMDMSIDAIYLVDRGTMRFVDVNEAACRGVGYSREQLLSMGPQDLLASPRADLEHTYDEVIASGSTGVRSENSYAGASGRKRWTELHRRALRTSEGWIIVSISRDITERKLAEQRQAAHARHQERIARFGQLALGKREPGELIEEAVQNVLEGLGAGAVAYVERAAGEHEVVLRAVVGVAAEEGSRHAAVRCREDTAILRVLRSGSRAIGEDTGLPYAWARALRGAAMVPVRGERDLRGALCVFLEAAGAFGAEEINFIEAVASVLSTAMQRLDSEGRLAYLAQFDPLTGLPNRALLADRFSQMIVQARRRSSPLGVLFIDLDEFKMVNDTLGHAGGDELLKEVSVRLQASVRPGDTVARISGDEFAVVLADLARPEDASLVAQKIIDRLAQAVQIHGQEIFVTGSIGIALFPGDGADAETLIGAADAAMYRAKQSGRNAYQFFTAEINQRSRARAQLGSELRRAVEHEEFFLVYQPKVALADRRPSGAEALLRWKHPERGTVSPVEFIPVLEETGLIVAVGEWVLRRACEDHKSWQAAGFKPGPVSVNLSARQFRLPDLDARLKAIVGAAGVAPSMIELEITESQLVQDPDHAIRMMRSLCEAGMRIAIDDFGTGYSSLSYLTRFPVGSLKIDRSFVRDLIEDKSDATIVRTIIEMAHTLGFTVVAEGIETEAQADYLREHRCEEGQGFLFAKPMPAGELAAFLASAAARPRKLARKK